MEREIFLFSLKKEGKKERKKKKSDVRFAQADLGTAVHVPLASQGGNVSPQCCHQKTVVQLIKCVLEKINIPG
jgi:hypothetical protein